MGIKAPHLGLSSWLLLAAVSLAAAEPVERRVGGDDPRAAAGLSPAAPAPAGRVWKRPIEWAPPSVRYSIRRWLSRLPPQVQFSEGCFQRGDDLRWAQPGWDDRDWRVMSSWDMPARSGVNWLRFRVRMGPEGGERLPAGIMISTVGAYQVFWDGVLLGNSGVPADNREDEVPGRVDAWYSLPADLAGPGEHVVALRLSSYRCGFPAKTSGFRFLVDAPENLQGIAVREALIPSVAAGAMLMVGMASLILWLLAARRLPLLLLGGMCLSATLMQALHAHRWFFPYPADWHFPALMAMSWLVAAQSLCLVAFVLVHFAVPRARWLLAGVVVAFGLVAWLGPERMNLEGVQILAIGLVVSLACSGWAVVRRRRGAWAAAVGVLVSSFLLTFEPEDYRTYFFVKFLPAMLGLMVSLAMQLREERRQAQAALLATARLELEVLKKNIQPHFLLNTLATIIEVIEREPRTAVALIEALANEFRVLARVSGEKLIPLAQEIELCRAHLRIMSLRKGVSCSLKETGTDGSEQVPPALFHTLVENGLTHLMPKGGEQRFELRAEREAGVIRYTLRAHGIAADRSNPAPLREGTGLRYIKARLEESFPGRWSVRAGPVATGWQTVIEIAADADSAKGAPA